MAAWVLSVLALYGAWMGSSVTRMSLASEDRASSLYGWDTSLYSWESGISLERPVRWGEFGRAIWERWFGGRRMR